MKIERKYTGGRSQASMAGNLRILWPNWPVGEKVHFNPLYM